MSERPRISGTEMEYAILVQPNKGNTFRYIEATEAKRMMEGLNEETGLYKTNDADMLSNGGRAYVDAGTHPEYCTPESTSFAATVAYEIAGERVMYDVTEGARQRGEFYDYRILKRVIDDILTTSGYHFSLSADASKVQIDEQSLMPLAPHLATVNILTGAGAVILDKKKGGYKYVVGQKAATLDSDTNASSYGGNNPLISLRREPHSADAHGLVRVHITSLDANMSPWASWMKLGTTSLVLGMMERGYLDESEHQPLKDKMFRIGSVVAQDPDMVKRFAMQDGRKLTALDIQRDLLERARKMADDGYATDEEIEVIGEWERALGDFEVDPYKLVDRVEWLARRQILEAHMARHSITDWGHNNVRKIDRHWSYLGDGIGERVREAKWSKWMPSEDQIEKAYRTPPDSTRAMARASLIDYHMGKGRSVSAGWGYVKVHRSELNTEHMVNLPSPYSWEVNSEDYF